MSAEERESTPGDALENEFRAMFAERSETVRVTTAPYAAVRQRIVTARRKRRLRIGGAGVAVAMAVAGIGAWATVPTTHHRAVAPGSSASTNGSVSTNAATPTATGTPAKVVYADGHTEMPDGPLREAALGWLRDQYRGDLTGLTVVTTFDRDIQNAANQAASDSGVAVLDTRDGAVLALAGQWQSPLQTGDLMKPVVLAAALKNATATAATKLPLDAQQHPVYWPKGAHQPITYVSGDHIVNWPPESPSTHIEDIDVTLRQAAEIGANEPFVQLELASGLGPSAVRDMAVALGMPYDTQDMAPVPALALGTPRATPLSMAVVSATLADDGVRHDPRMVGELLGSAGKLIWTAPDSATRVLTPTAAHQVTDILHSALTDGTTGAYAGARAGAGSGTWAMAAANSAETAAWFDGADSHYAVSVGVAQWDENGTPIRLGADGHGGPDVGSRLAGPIWAGVVQKLRTHG